MKLEPVRKLSKNATLEVVVEITREFKVRMFIAMTCFRFGAWILGCGCDIKTTDCEENNADKSD